MAFSLLLDLRWYCLEEQDDIMVLPELQNERVEWASECEVAARSLWVNPLEPTQLSHLP